MRGQLFSYDFILSAVFVISLMALFVLATNTVVNGINEVELRSEIGDIALTAADSLIRTPGDPSNWELFPIDEDTTRSLGLANSPGELDPEKVGRFFSISNTSAEYNATLPILGLTRAVYRYNATLENLDGTALSGIMRFPSGNPPQIFSTERLVSLNGTVVKFRMVVWRE